MASLDEETKPCFGRLMQLNEKGKPPEPISVTKRKFVIGRAKDCDLSLNDRMVSGHHCYMETMENGLVYLYDTSSNGTLLNESLLTHGQKQLLNTGDKFRIVFKKGCKAVGFIFNSSTACDNEQDDANSLNDTEEYDFQLPENATDRNAVVQTKSENQDFDHQISGNIDVPKTNNPTAQGSKPAKKVADKNGDDELEDHLTCCICQEILYKPISLQPCMHCYCSGCYSDWMELSEQCPKCRLNVKRVGPNHIVGNLVEAYLKLHPEKRRDKEDIKVLEAKNKITRDMLYPGKQLQNQSSESEASSDEYGHKDFFPVIPNVRINRKRGTLDRIQYNKTSERQAMCRQCPGYRGNRPAKHRKIEDIGPSNSNQPSTSTGSLKTTFTCKLTTEHVVCSCCFEYMPNRARETEADSSVPPQRCNLCVSSAYYCNMYWDCKDTCLGCLAPLRNMLFDDDCLETIINGNRYESKALRGYLEKQKMGWHDVYMLCMAKLDAGAFTIDVNKIRGLPLIKGTGVSSQTAMNIQKEKTVIGGETAGHKRNIIMQGTSTTFVSRPDLNNNYCTWLFTKPEMHFLKTIRASSDTFCEMENFNAAKMSLLRPPVLSSS